MPSYKLGRTTEDIRREVSAILRELKDPRVSGCMLSVVRVEVTNDLSYCTVYVSAMEGMETADDIVWTPRDSRDKPLQEQKMKSIRVETV